MIDNPQPDSGRSSAILLHYAKTALLYEELRSAIDGGHESMTHDDALAEISAIRAENETLRAGYDAARLEIESLRAAHPPGVAGLVGALEDAQRAINSMKVEAETAAQGDEQMMLEACETISNEGLQADMAIRAALASHGQAPAQAAPASLQVPKGWSFAVSHSDGRVWLTISTPHGASATLSAAEKTGNGDDTIVAQVLGYLADSLAAPAAMAGPWSAGELDGNWLHIDHKDHAGVIRIVWKMEGDARSPVCEARAMAVIDALNAYTAPQPSPTPQADSVTAPAAGAVAHTISDAQIEAMPVWRNFVGLWPESRREIVDAVVDLLAAAPTPPAQAADSVLEDAARYRYLRDVPMDEWPDELAIAFRLQQNAIWDTAIDAARKQGANHD